MPAAEKPIEYPSLAAALAAFQTSLPTVSKGATGQVGQNRNYKYADLGDLNGVVLPRLGAVGLSFSSKPTINESGRFVLAYVLRHVSGEEDAGEWPLPENVAPQQIGSALTYYRRYALQALTGVAPDEDDDGRAAQEAHNQRPPAQARQHEHARNARPAQPQTAETPAEEKATPVVSKEAKEALEELAATCDAMGYDRGMVAKVFAAEHNKADIRKAATPEQAAVVRKFIAHLDDVDPTRLKAPAVATNGAQA